MDRGRLSPSKLKLSKQPLRLGSRTKPWQATTSSLAKGPLAQGGGKGGMCKKENSNGANKLLDKWLLRLGRKAGCTSVEDQEQRES